MRALTASATRALLLVAVVALVADALLGGLTGALSSVAGGPSTPWWVSGHVLERSRWVVFALGLLVLVRRPPIADLVDALDSPPAVWRLVGTLTLALPLLWTLSSMAVSAALFTIADRWDIDGQVFLSAGYYRQAFAGYAPWLLGGMAGLVLARHAS